MIYGKDFVWVHFPKCAGTKIENLFKKYYSDERDIFQDPFHLRVDPTKSWHDSIDDRLHKSPELSFEGKQVIIPFRRLPDWLVSRYNFENKRSPELPHRPEKLLEGRFLEAGGFENHADAYIKRYLADNILENFDVKFIRVEYFEEDFKAVFRDLIDIEKIPDSEYGKKTNPSSGITVDDIFCGDKELSIVYDNCPNWKKVEEIAYS